MTLVLGKEFEAEIGVIVMPPGHGKSYMSLPPGCGIYEADYLLDCRGTPELSRLRDYARESGDWSQYDVVWSKALVERCGSMSCVILVPSVQLARLINPEGIIFICALTEATFKNNLTNRKGSFDKYYHCWAEAKHLGTTFAGNDELQDTVKKKAQAWLAERGA